MSMQPRLDCSTSQSRGCLNDRPARFRLVTGEKCVPSDLREVRQSDIDSPTFKTIGSASDSARTLSAQACGSCSIGGQVP